MTSVRIRKYNDNEIAKFISTTIFEGLIQPMVHEYIKKMKLSNYVKCANTLY